MHQRDQGVLGFLPAHRVDLGKLAEDLPGGKGGEMTAGGDVSRVAGLTQRQRECQKILRSPLKGQREPDHDWRW